MGNLVYKPTKLPEEVIECIKKDVKKKIYKSDNNAIVSILSKHYGKVKPKIK